MNPDITAILALLLTPGVGATTAGRVLAAARLCGESVRGLLALSPRALAALLPPGFEQVVRARTWYDAHNYGEAAQLLTRVRKMGGLAFRIGDAGYPPALGRYLDTTAPPLLFVLGDPSLLIQPAAAVVGTRSPSENGVRMAHGCARLLVWEGAVLVSGGAAGVDTVAHHAALDAGGKTAVVLPQGLLTYRCSKAFACALHDHRLVLVSQFPPATGWETYAAVTRNATISALARLVCVIEPKKQGGSLRTARCALAQRKRVLVCGSGGSAGPAKLFRFAPGLEIIEGPPDAACAQRLWRLSGQDEADAGLFAAAVIVKQASGALTAR